MSLPATEEGGGGGGNGGGGGGERRNGATGLVVGFSNGAPSPSDPSDGVRLSRTSGASEGSDSLDLDVLDLRSERPATTGAIARSQNRAIPHRGGPLRTGDSSPVGSPPTGAGGDRYYSSSAGSHDNESSPHDICGSHTGSHITTASYLATSPSQFHSVSHLLPPTSPRARPTSGLSEAFDSKQSSPTKRPDGSSSGGGGGTAAAASRLNPFSFHVAADALALKELSHKSYARRRWLHVNEISEMGGGGGGGEEAKQDGELSGELRAAVYSNSSVVQHLEHQWTSLSEPAVLPLTTDPTSEHIAVMQTHQSAESSWWRLDVPRQEELSGIPYSLAMSAEELLQELLCQRLEQDFQLLRPRNKSKLLTLRKEQTYYLSQGNQVQQITFVQDGQGYGQRQVAGFAPKSRSQRTRSSQQPPAATAVATAVPAAPTSFSEIRVTRHLMSHRHQRGGGGSGGGQSSQPRALQTDWLPLLCMRPPRHRLPSRIHTDTAALSIRLPLESIGSDSLWMGL